MSVTLHRGLCSPLDEEFVHLGNAADLVRGTIHSEHEDEDDGEQDCSMRAVGPDEFREGNYGGDSLVAEEGRTHTTSDDVDADT